MAEVVAAAGFGCRLVLRKRLLSVQVRCLTSATSSGRTQCTRLSTSGDPKRLLRGGGTS
jgi:hypothetical protein